MANLVKALSHFSMYVFSTLFPICDEDIRKLAVLCASRGQLDASVKLLECLSECGTLQTGILTTTTHLILNHIVSYCKVRITIIIILLCVENFQITNILYQYAMRSLLSILFLKLISINVCFTCLILHSMTHLKWLL